MDTRSRMMVLCTVCGLMLSISASKCPEPRKPHVTSCAIFYNCINLPEGGYVWAPAKCPEGLVFQPYLRICVLPGDTWTCDNLATTSSPVEHYEAPGSIEPVRTSYLGYTQESSPFTAHPSTGASYPMDGISELGNRRVATPYPLLEILDTDRKAINDNHKPTENSPPPIERRVENYLYQFINGQQKYASRLAETSDDNRHDIQSTWLNGFINRMLFYEYFSGSSKQEIFSNNPSIAQIGSTTCEPDTSSKKSELFSNLNSDILSYIVKSYILGRRQSDGKLKKIKKIKTTTTTTEAIGENDEEFVDLHESSGDKPLNLLIDGSKAENNIVAIRGNLGNKEYITIAKYKSLSKDVPLQVLEILPCAKGIRLLNRTDCTKYYTCDPDTASIVRFSCSSKTAFNGYNRVCESQRYKACVKQLNDVTHAPTADDPIQTTLNPPRMESTAKKNPCTTTGKFVDPESDRNYYVCYSSQATSSGIDSIMMTCPSELIFCQERRLCTTRKRCYD